MLQHLKNWREFVLSKLQGMLGGSVSTKQKIMYAKRLSFLLGAHVPIVRALRMIESQLALRSGKRALFSQIVSGIDAGQRLSDIPQHRSVFGRLATPLIRLGEESGTLHTSFQLVTEELEKSYELKQKIMSALLYPSIILVGTVSLLLLLVVMVFPRLMSVFSGLNITLPLSTRIVLGLSLFLQQWWWAVLCGVGVLSALCSYIYRKKRSVQVSSQKVLLHVPIVAQLIRAYQGARITRMIGLLLSHGTDLITALAIVAEHTDHVLYRQVITDSKQASAQGELFSSVLQKHVLLFQADYVHIIATGEQGASMAESLIYVADMCAKELEYLSKTLTVSIEPVLMITIGCIVAGMALSIITPMYQITQHLQR